ncbi:uncharacterized protein [Dysidea avara]
MQECVRSGRLSHPNIVKFIGLHYPVGASIPRLVLEWLHCSLTCRLEGNDHCHQPINFIEKLSIFVHIARGLEYLHSQCPPIVHCDLTSDNILLSEKVAKIGSLGLVRIVDPESRSQIIRAPGTRDFMPPEVLSDQPQYETEVDVFSFGCVMLHTLSNRWPTPSESVGTDPQMREQSEVERRQQYLDMLAYDGSVENDQLEMLLYVIQDCLSDLPVDRPKIFGILEYLKINGTSKPVPPKNNSAKSKRILKELQEMEENESPFVTAGPVASDIYHWQAIIIGPPGSPYEDGAFILRINFPTDYPFRRPRIVFSTEIYHPNIDLSGIIKSEILELSYWNPSMTITTVLFRISDLLNCPSLDPVYVVRSDVAAMYQENHPQYIQLAREWTQKYAT